MFKEKKYRGPCTIPLWFILGCVGSCVVMINNQYWRYYSTVCGYMLDIYSIFYITLAIRRIATAKLSSLASNRIGPVNLHSLLEHPWCCMSMMDCIVNLPGRLPFLPAGSFLCTFAPCLFLANTACSCNNSKIINPNRKRPEKTSRENVQRKRPKTTSKDKIQRKRGEQKWRGNVERKRPEKTSRENVERKRGEKTSRENIERKCGEKTWRVVLCFTSSGIRFKAEHFIKRIWPILWHWKRKQESYW